MNKLFFCHCVLFYFVLLRSRSTETFRGVFHFEISVVLCTEMSLFKPVGGSIVSLVHRIVYHLCTV